MQVYCAIAIADVTRCGKLVMLLLQIYYHNGFLLKTSPQYINIGPRSTGSTPSSNAAKIIQQFSRKDWLTNLVQPSWSSAIFSLKDLNCSRVSICTKSSMRRKLASPPFVRWRIFYWFSFISIKSINTFLWNPKIEANAKYYLYSNIEIYTNICM